MKHNVFGYLFVIFVILIMGFSIYKAKFDDKDNENNNKNTINVNNAEKIGEITLAIANLDSINPIITNNKQVQNITKVVYDSLVNITADFKVQSALAKEWTTADGLSYVIKLRSGVKWSDGSNFTSNDVKFTIDRLKENTDSIYSENMSLVEEVDIIDDTTLRIILSEQVTKFEYYLNFPIMSSSYYSGVDFWDTEKNKAPITTGRYKISEVTGSTIILEKNESWWNIKNEYTFINKININLYSSLAELYNAFKLGNIDFISTNNNEYEKYIGTIGYNTTEIEGREFIFMALNTQNQLLSDANIRKSIRSALNKDEIVSNVQGYSTANFMLNTNSYLINRTDENYYNLAETSNTLTSMNWLMRNGVWQKSINHEARKLEFNMVVKSSDSNRVEIAKNIRDQLARQGILINLIGASEDEYNAYLENKNYDIILCSADLPVAPDLTTYFGGDNLANYNNEEISEIMNAIRNITDENELKARYQRLYEIYNGEAPYIGIARNKIRVFTNVDFVGEIKSNWVNLFYGIKDWYKK